MNKFFDPNGLFAQIMNTILNMMLLNAMWMLCSIPIITMGASTAALYAVLIKMRDGEEPRVIRRYFAALKENWKKASAAWLALLLAAAICGLDLYFAGQMDNDIFRIIAVAGLVVIVMTATFVFPLVARFENKWSNHLKNALLLALSHAPRLLMALALWGGAILLTFFSANTLYMMVLMWLMAGFSCLSYATLWILTPVLRKLEPETQETAGDLME